MSFVECSISIVIAKFIALTEVHVRSCTIHSPIARLLEEKMRNRFPPFVCTSAQPSTSATGLQQMAIGNLRSLAAAVGASHAWAAPGANMMSGVLPQASAQAAMQQAAMQQAAMQQAAMQHAVMQQAAMLAGGATLQHATLQQAALQQAAMTNMYNMRVARYPASGLVGGLQGSEQMAAMLAGGATAAAQAGGPHQVALEGGGGAASAARLALGMTDRLGLGGLMY